MKGRKNLLLSPFNIPSQGLSNLVLCTVMRGGRFHHAHVIEEKNEAELHNTGQAGAECTHSQHVLQELVWLLLRVV